MNIKELKRQERLIEAWIRDVTAEKRAKLYRIRGELKRLRGQTAGNTVKPKYGAR